MADVVECSVKAEALFPRQNKEWDWKVAELELGDYDTSYCDESSWENSSELWD